LAIAEFICLSAFAIELSRAVSGNTLSWAYVFEWPILGGYAVYMWRNLGADDGSPSTPSEVDVDALQTYNEYLVRVHETTSDHPGAPPTN
jgi:hypothetical protein